MQLSLDAQWLGTIFPCSAGRHESESNHLSTMNATKLNGYMASLSGELKDSLPTLFVNSTTKIMLFGLLEPYTAKVQKINFY